MIIGLHVEKVDIPHDPENWMRVRTALSPYSAMKARAAKQNENLKMIAETRADIGDEGIRNIVDMLESGKSAKKIADEINSRALPSAERNEVGSAEQPEVLPAEEDVQVDQEEEEEKEETLRAKYDLDVAAKELIVDWSYLDERKRPLPVKLKYIRHLDEATRQWIHNLAWEAMKPQTEQDRSKNS